MTDRPPIPADSAPAPDDVPNWAVEAARNLWRWFMQDKTLEPPSKDFARIIAAHATADLDRLAERIARDLQDRGWVKKEAHSQFESHDAEWVVQCVLRRVRALLAEGIRHERDAEVVEVLKEALLYAQHDLDEINERIGPGHSCGTPDSNCDCDCMARASVSTYYGKIRKLLARLEAKR